MMPFALARSPSGTDALGENLEVWVDNFMKPGNLQGGFNRYRGIDEARTELWRHGAPELSKIEVPTRFFWGEDDPLVKLAWADRLGEARDRRVLFEPRANRVNYRFGPSPN